jgi:ABC-type branched-subunit amino acid transport system substrate-binding protein
MRAFIAHVTDRLHALPRSLAPLALAALAAGCASQPQGQGAVTTAPAATPTAAAPNAVDLSRPVTVALLAPRSAARSDFQAAAADIEAAARMVADRAPAPGVALRVYDTAGTPQGAAAAAQRAVADGAAVILGPVFSDTTEAAAPAATARGITVLSMSSDARAAGDGVWVLGDLPENDADRILGYAASQGLRRVAGVRPQSLNGDLAERAVRAAAPRHGMAATEGLSYARSFEGVQQAVTDGAAALQAQGPDALVLADSGQALSIVAAFLDFNEISPRETQFLGLSAWRGPQTLQEPSLRGGLFAGVDPDAGAGFEAAFRDSIGRTPHPRAWLGHDAMIVVTDLLADARAAGDATPFDAADVARAGGFRGARGPFALTADGGNRRALSVFEVTADGFALRDGPPPAAGL